MNSRKFLAVGLCGMIGLGLVQRVSATEGTSDNTVPVSYDYTGSAEPVDPKYGVSIPTGMVFDSQTPDNILSVNVGLKPAQGETEITGPCSATVTVKSVNEYKVKLADGSDEIEYVVKYGGVPLSGAEAVEIGTLSKGVGDTDTLEIVGTAKLQGVATKTGNHMDTLTYTITNVAVN